MEVVYLIQLITTGGTIASTPDESGDVTASLSGKDLLQRLGINEHLKIKNAVTLGSYAFNYSTLHEIALHVIDALNDENVSGIVITHGTDTMEETIFYLSLVLEKMNKPVILTGAQIDPSFTYTDGTKNLQEAIIAAKTSYLKEFGPLIVFGGFIYHATDVTKVDTHLLQGFDAPNVGPIGRIDVDEVVIYSKVQKLNVNLKPKIPLPTLLIRLGIGMTGAEIEQIVSKYQGIVIEGFGRGNAHPSITPVVKKLVETRIPVLITSRCFRGAVKPVYGKGGGQDLEKVGSLFAGNLSGVKARILLGLALANNFSLDELKKAIYEISNSITKIY